MLMTKLEVLTLLAENAYDLEVASYKLDRQSLEETVVDSISNEYPMPA